jgi:hypothetical protein
MTYSLERIEPADHAGDSGPMSNAVWLDENDQAQSDPDARPRVGAAIQVGSFYARSFQRQDWWRTSIITEILEDEEDKVIFKTRNSKYLWQILK